MDLCVIHIPSRENINADRESRRTNIHTEWEIAEPIFNKIIEKWGLPEIDLFTSRINAKVKKFCSWKRNPEAFLIDAFTISWKLFLFCISPIFYDCENATKNQNRKRGN